MFVRPLIHLPALCALVCRPLTRLDSFRFGLGFLALGFFCGTVRVLLTNLVALAAPFFSPLTVFSPGLEAGLGAGLVVVLATTFFGGVVFGAALDVGVAARAVVASNAAVKTASTRDAIVLLISLPTFPRLLEHFISPYYTPGSLPGKLPDGTNETYGTNGKRTGGGLWLLITI